MRSSLQDALDRVLAVEGVQTVAVIDVASGMVVRSAGERGPGFPAAAASVADEARAARGALGPRSAAGDLDEIAVVTGSRLHLAKVLQSQPEEGLLLFVDMDRARANVALASLQVGQLAPTLLA